ncbi:MAG: DUF882 domain-containing protein [Nannocystaceae bacterium]
MRVERVGTGLARVVGVRVRYQSRRRFTLPSWAALLALAGLLALGEGRVAIAASALPSVRISPVDPSTAPPVELAHVRRQQVHTLRLFDDAGRIRVAARAELRAFLACVRTGEDHPIHWRLATVLAAVGAHWRGRTIFIVSGYRHPSVSRHAKRSNHTRGRAIDLRVEGVPNRVLRDALRNSFAGIGVGYYPNSSFVHIDVRERDGQWIDYAGPRQAPCYSRDVAGDLRSGRAETTSYDDALRGGCRGHGKRAQLGRKRGVVGERTETEHGATRTIRADP